MYRAFFSFVSIGFLSVCGQYFQSPCPDYFDYRSDGNGVFGAIKLQPFGPVSTLLVKANFTIAARLPSTYAGSIVPVGSELHLLQEFNRGAPLQYRVNFPVVSPVPKLTALIVNDNVVCYGPGDPLTPGQYVSTISLRHMLFFKSGTNGLYPVHNRPQTQRPEVVYGHQTPSTSHINPTNFISYVDNTNDNTRKPDGQTYYVVDNGRPVYQSPDIYPESFPDYFNQPNFIVDTPERQTTRVTTVRTTTTRSTTQRPRTTLPPEPVPQPDPLNVGSSSAECGINMRNDPTAPLVPLIVKGENFERGEWPWLVAIFKRRFSSLSYICAGTLVSDKHVITAAHCMQRESTYTAINNLVVRAGVYNLEDWNDDDITVTRSLAAAAIHDAYNASTLANDILVLTLAKSVPISAHIRPACLWSGNTNLKMVVGKLGVVAGWGANEMGSGGKGEPRMVEMPIVSLETCRSSREEFHRLTSSKTLCAGDHSGAGPCLGDSGGGLYIQDKGRWRIRGVVSLSLRAEGDAICNLDDYIVFTDTAQYLPWINTVMNNYIR
ncbi:serine protease gd-like isoform X1 [Bicyclus anynana]|uniref:Serine protease gd-like isoform X1 n=1 Tax=Bicyclus anynana TaxID=110368 RepID=A0ABM3LI67_BICAN|nr:serine protease gd-like isoform X1 [Bicyclus anynana]